MFDVLSDFRLYLLLMSAFSVGYASTADDCPDRPTKGYLADFLFFAAVALVGLLLWSHGGAAIVPIVVFAWLTAVVGDRLAYVPLARLAARARVSVLARTAAATRGVVGLWPAYVRVQSASQRRAVDDSCAEISTRV